MPGEQVGTFGGHEAEVGDEEEEDFEEEEVDPAPKPRSRKCMLKGDQMLNKRSRETKPKSISDNPYGIYPSTSTSGTLEAMRLKWEMYDELEFKVPGSTERPWDYSDGYICLYEAMF